MVCVIDPVPAGRKIRPVVFAKIMPGDFMGLLCPDGSVDPGSVGYVEAGRSDSAVRVVWSARQVSDDILLGVREKPVFVKLRFAGFDPYRFAIHNDCLSDDPEHFPPHEVSVGSASLIVQKAPEIDHHAFKIGEQRFHAGGLDALIDVLSALNTAYTAAGVATDLGTVREKKS